MLTHMHVHGCEQAQPAVHPRVLLCRMALLSSALQVEEIEPLVRGKEQRREGEKRSAAVLPIVVMAGTGCVLDASRRVGKGAAVVVVVSSGSAQQLQRRVLINMRNGGGVGGRAVCSFVTRSSSGGAASIPALHVGEASHPSAACWCVGSGKEERERGKSSTPCGRVVRITTMQWHTLQ